MGNAEAKKIAAEAASAMATATKKKDAAAAVLKKIEHAACAKHAGCKGLEGYCCPTLDFNKMHLGSSQLSGASLGCCGGASELEMEEVAEGPAMSIESDISEAAPKEFGLTSMFLAFVTGIAVSAAVLKASSRTRRNDGEYHNLAAA